MDIEAPWSDAVRGRDKVRREVYARVAEKVIEEVEDGMRPRGSPKPDATDLGIDLKLLLSQMTNELAAETEGPFEAQKDASSSHAEEFFEKTGAVFTYGGDWPFYAADEDVIYFPFADSYRRAEERSAVKARELVHWTGHRSRLNRNYGSSKYGTEGHAREKLVAEFGAAYLCALLGVTAEVSKRHAANVACWLRAIKRHRRTALSLAATDAGYAVDYLYLLQRHIIVANLENTNTT